MKHHALPERRSGGFTLMELMISLVIIGLISLWIMRLAIEQADAARNAQVARQTRGVALAAERYVYANHDALMAKSMAPGHPFVVTIADLLAGHYLQGATGANNAFGQHYELRIIKSGGQLQPIVLSVGGQKMDGATMRSIARMITSDGGAGGFIDNPPGVTYITGGAGWQVKAADYGTSPGVGHIADAVFFTVARQEEAGDLSLHRVKDPANPAANRMETDLDMHGHRIVNARSLDADRIGVAGKNPDSGYPSGWSGGVHTTDLYAEGSVGVGQGGALKAAITPAGDFYSYGNGWFRSTGAHGWYNQTYKGGIYMTDANWVRVYNNKGFYTAGQIKAGSMVSEGQLKADSIVSEGRLDTKEYLQIEGKVTLNTTCSPEGLMGRGKNGEGMAQCRGGKWQLMQGISDIEVRVSDYSCNTGGASAGDVEVAQCPANYMITGGGYYSHRYSADSATAPTVNRPEGNGWSVRAGAKSNACYAAYAVCAQ